MESEKKKNSLGDRITYFYIKNIRKRMFCPVCKNGKMTFHKKNSLWRCEDCGYHFSEKYFLDDCVFWFCDECQTYLNNQDGFDSRNSKHICRNCGYENDTTFDNITGICLDCGKVLPSLDTTLCAECRSIRRENAKQWLITTGKVVAGATLAVGAAVLAAQATSVDESEGDMPLAKGEEDLMERFSYATVSWMQTASEDELRSTACEMKKVMDERNWDDSCSAVYGIYTDIVNTIASRFPLNLPHREHGWYLSNDD